MLNVGRGCAVNEICHSVANLLSGKDRPAISTCCSYSPEGLPVDRPVKEPADRVELINVHGWVSLYSVHSYSFTQIDPLISQYFMSE